MAGCLVLFGATRLVADENNIDKHWVLTPNKKSYHLFHSPPLHCGHLHSVGLLRLVTCVDCNDGRVCVCGPTCQYFEIMNYHSDESASGTGYDHLC